MGSQEGSQVQVSQDSTQPALSHCRQIEAQRKQERVHRRPVKHCDTLEGQVAKASAPICETRTKGKVSKVNHRSRTGTSQP